MSVQEQLKALHEMRRAGFLAEASSAESEAAELRRRFDAEDSMSSLFPEISRRPHRPGSDSGRQATSTLPRKRRRVLLPPAPAPRWWNAPIAR